MLEHTVQQLRGLLRRPRLAIVVVLVVSLLLVGYVEARKEITLVVDGKSRTVLTMRATVGALLKQEGIELDPEDLVEPDYDAKLDRKMTVNIRRAVPVTLEVGGVVWEVKTAQPTVGKALTSLDIVVGNQDRLDPPAFFPVIAGKKITVIRVEETETKEEVKIPYKVERRQDGNLEIGRTRVVQRGVDGVAERRLRRLWENGELAQEEVVSEQVIKEPVTEIVAVGSMGTLSRGGTNYSYSRVIDAEATAYCPTDDGGGVTATGIKPKRGIVAVDPRVIPLGTKVYVENYGPALAADTGGAIKGNRVDVFLDTHEEAVRWGRRWVKVYVLK
ncbi:MAG: DUF348 domain-containing protein [Firmicutes bacterium]|nr:DUF348 domain-containing protein [Bacillota bacterium]